MESSYMSKVFTGNASAEDPNELRFSSLVVFILFILAEAWCVFSTVKVFKVRAALIGISMLAIFLCLHMMFVLRIFYCLGILACNYDRSQISCIENLAVLSKDLFIAILAWRLMEVVYSLDDSKKFLIKLINVLRVIMVVHIVIFSVLLLLWLTDVASTKTFGTYCSLIEVVFALIYIFSCVEVIRFWRGSNIKSGLSGYLRWLFIIMIYMIFVLVIRVMANVLEICEFEDFEFFTIYKMFIYILIELVPGSIMCICLYIMAGDFDSSNDTLFEAYTDE